ncbi:hypothetical protein F5Y08DRAFT_175616 [Xylaria arbuscula]|nr:hypothetical protein F5Y08DRAFT_175616 [Xylaria arbuscula]
MDSFSIHPAYRQDNSALEPAEMTPHAAAGIGDMSSRRTSSRANFSYPSLSRHESNESRSSNGSIPGMTDASDSDISFDDDGSYNTSAGELWDSFWPENAESSSSAYRYSQESQVALLQPRQQKDYLKINPVSYHQYAGADDDTIKISDRGYDLQEEEPPSPRTSIKPLPTQSTPLLSTPPRPAPKRSPVTYSVYPKPPVYNIPRLPHPPRTSSLSFEPPSPPRRPSFLRGSRSSAALKASKSIHNMHSLFIAPSTAPPPNKATALSSAKGAAASVPVSPLYPPPPPLRTLRPSTSAFSLRDKIRLRSSDSTTNRGPTSQTHSATMAPPPQLLPSPLPEQPLLTTRPHHQFVSVFELDSDSEAEADDDAAAAEGGRESRSFARRWARGLHKNKRSGAGAGEKRGGVAERKASSSTSSSGPSSLTTTTTAATVSLSDADYDEGDVQRLSNGGSLSRKRGGSLGRIFGFIAGGR